MKKRILSLAVVLAMCLATLPVPAGAAGQTETVTLYLEDGSISITPSNYPGSYTYQQGQ